MYSRSLTIEKSDKWKRVFFTKKVEEYKISLERTVSWDSDELHVLQMDRAQQRDELPKVLRQPVVPRIWSFIASFLELLHKVAP